MALDWLIRMAGHFEGLSDHDLDQIEKALPATKQLIDTTIALKPTIEKLLPLYQQAMPIIQTALPVINKAIPEIQAALNEWAKVAPAVSIVLNKLNKRQTVNVADLANSGFPWT